MTLDVLDWRRRTAALYELVRAEIYPEVAHAGWAATREELFRTHPASPVRDPSYDLPVAPYDAQWRAEVALEPAPPARIEIPTGTDGVVPFERLGVLRTPWGDLDAWWLASYGGGVWVPVRDRTSGSATYGGGRYLLDTIKGADLGSTADGRLVLDLNFLYAPSCAHDEAWACPLAPPGNVLDVEVLAGELSR
ncbi:MAG TPA: DUF1684 domain-containing protein [Mycobacteriales bacterium]|nr:DUF1684 domain-containing protein [Mycobacteriales bacterium]